MRVTSSMYYKNMYGQTSSQVSEKLFDVNRQISSGEKIQYADDDVSVFSQTMTLDNEVTLLTQVKESTTNGYNMSNQADVVLNEFDTTTDRIKTLLLNAANDATNSEASLDAIAKELRGLESYLKDLANTSINGEYLFAGSKIDTKPISEDGTYRGDDKELSIFAGNGVDMQYNISGAELFLGEEGSVRRVVTTNVEQYSLSELYTDFMGGSTSEASSDNQPIIGSNSIRDLMGDNDADIATINTSYFYISGTKSDGSTINEKISMTDNETVQDLLDNIGDVFGNTANADIVNVTLNDSGQIVIEDKMKGSSKLEFHMVGAVDYTGAGAADVNQVNNLDVGESDFGKIVNGTTTAANPNLYVKEFVRSPYDTVTGVGTNIDGLVYDRTQFVKEGSTLSSSIPQIQTDDNAFATPKTKLSEVADLSQGTAGTLDGTTLELTGTTTSGVAYTAQINLNSAGSTFTLDGGVTNYDIFDMGDPRVAVDADEMTYQQLMDVVNMVVSGNTPAANTEAAYDTAIQNSNTISNTTLSYDGRLEFKELNKTTTDASIAMYDSNAGDFSVGADSSVMTFNANNSLVVTDAKTDFFKELDEIITAVEDAKLYPDSQGSHMRSIGIENAIEIIDDLKEHLTKSHTTVGVQSKALQDSQERADLMLINTQTLRSSVIDTDLAEASLILTQMQNNYQAMLMTVGKVSQLNLVNYL